MGDETTTIAEPVLPAPLFPGGPAELVWIGDDGQWLVARGHTDAAVFRCLAVAHTAANCGLEEAGELLRYLTDHEVQPRQVWATDGVENGCDFLTWLGVTAETPGAYAVTVVETGA